MTLPLEAYGDTLSRVSEDELVMAHLPAWQARPCACGGVVVADPRDPTEGVKEHQQTARHRAWRAWRES